MRKIGLWLAAFLAAMPIAGVLGSAPASAREVVAFNGGYGAGTIIIRTNERRLYLVLGDGSALRYPVGVGTAGMQWQGTTIISGKFLKPAWTPPAIIKKEKPSLPDVIAGARLEQSNGGRGDDTLRRRVRDPRYQHSGFNRRLRVARLHPDVQRRYHGSV